MNIQRITLLELFKRYEFAQAHYVHCSNVDAGELVQQEARKEAQEVRNELIFRLTSGE